MFCSLFLFVYMKPTLKCNFIISPSSLPLSSNSMLLPIPLKFMDSLSVIIIVLHTNNMHTHKYINKIY